MWFRAVPALLVGVLLVLAVLAPSRRAGAGAAGGTGAYVSACCGLVLQQGGSDTSFAWAQGAGITQPLGIVGNIAACSLTIVNEYRSGTRLEVVQWDPLALAPDPTTVALRSRTFTSSQSAYNQLRVELSPPVVLRPIPHLADPPRTAAAVDWQETGSSTAPSGAYERNGAAGTPVALQYSSGGSRTPLPGPHPVLSHEICGRDEGVQALRVVQSVMTTSVLIDESSYELIQPFHVPVQVNLHWVEFAFGTTWFSDVGCYAGVAIVDAQGLSSPQPALPPSMVESSFCRLVEGPPYWESNSDFDLNITLEPNHDYWLLARVRPDYRLYARAIDGSESTDFASAIGPLYSRTAAGGEWSILPNRAFCFRLIGVPLEPGARIGFKTPVRWPVVRDPGGVARGGTSHESSSAVGVTRSTPGSGPLRLRVAPNPSMGAALVSWTGAAGTTRVDVLDPQGRRVAGVAGIAGREGRWLWQGAHDDGRPLPTGVYFVRVADRSGRTSVERVVLAR